MKVRTRQGDTVDLICWRQYGYTEGAVEQVLDANPGLASLGATLPTGTLIELPDIAATARQAERINLWD